MQRFETIAKFIRAFIRDEEGALFAEYGILIAVLVIGLAAVMVTFSGRIGQWFTTIGDSLNGCGSAGC